MVSGTDQINADSTEDWRVSPLTVKLIAPSAESRSRFSVQRGDWRAVVEALGHAPRPAQFLGLGLDVAAGHVETDPITPNQVVGGRFRHVAATGAKGHHQLDLMVHIAGRDRIREAPVAAHGIGRFHEKKRRLTVWVMAHFAGMGGVVASHAKMRRTGNCVSSPAIGTLGGVQAGRARLIKNTQSGWVSRRGDGVVKAQGWRKHKAPLTRPPPDLDGGRRVAGKRRQRR